MKRYFIIILVFSLLVSHDGMTQWNTDPAQNSQISFDIGLIDDSFEVYPDTLYFLTPDEIFYGKMFYIINPHDYSLDMQYIQPMGSFTPGVVPWITDPWYYNYPVNIPAGDSLGTIVKWPVLDGSEDITILYDTLHINTVNSNGHVIIAVDSSLIVMGIRQNDNVNFRAFPNPFRQQINLDLEVNDATHADIRILDVLMKPVITLFDGRLNKGNNHFTWDGTDLNHNQVLPGVYIIVVSAPSGKQTYRVIRL